MYITYIFLKSLGGLFVEVQSEEAQSPYSDSGSDHGSPDDRATADMVQVGDPENFPEASHIQSFESLV